jgi:hypothetical protein
LKAIKATFLAGVQIQALTFSISNNHTTLQAASNVFGFAGILLDILAGCFALIGVIQLQKLHSLLLRRSSCVDIISSTLKERHELALLQDVWFLETMFLRVLGNIRAWDELLPDLQDMAKEIQSEIRKDPKNMNDIALLDYIKTADELANLRFGIRRRGTIVAFVAVKIVRILVLLGAMFFILGMLCFVKYGQPIGVWVACFVVVGMTLLVFILLVVGAAYS